MKKKFFLILMLSLFLMTGCPKETKFKSVDRTITGFHKVNVAEKIDDGVLYFKGDKILCFFLIRKKAHRRDGLYHH